MLHAIWHILQDLSPWLLLGAAAAGVLHVLVPRDAIHRAFSGYAGVVRAVLRPSFAFSV